jgi:hypothetical protein
MLGDGLTKFMDNEPLRTAVGTGMWSFLQPESAKAEKAAKAAYRKAVRAEGKPG